MCRAAWGAFLVQSGFVYKTGPAGPEYLGKKEFDLPLRAEETNSYIHQRERRVVRVDRIEPTNWNPNSGLIPTVYVSAVIAKQKPERYVVPRRRKNNVPSEI